MTTSTTDMESDRRPLWFDSPYPRLRETVFRSAPGRLLPSPIRLVGDRFHWCAHVQVGVTGEDFWVYTVPVESDKDHRSLHPWLGRTFERVRAGLDPAVCWLSFRADEPRTSWFRGIEAQLEGD